MNEFLTIQTATGWGQVLARFAAWIAPQPGGRCLDAGCGPGLLPALLAAAGSQAWGVDADAAAFRPRPLHPQVLCAEVLQLPFADQSFDLVSASNLLFFLPQPEAALREMRRVLRPGGMLGLLNPSEKMSLAAAQTLADAHRLDGVARSSLLKWAARAEAHARWGEADLRLLLADAGLQLSETRLDMGPGLARWARAFCQD